MSKKKSSDSCLGVMLKMTILLVVLAAILVFGGVFAFQKLNEFFNRSGGNVLVPDFRGKHTSEVMRIKPRDIEVVTRDQKYDDRQPKGHVIAQYPEPGTLVKPGKQVLLTISMGMQKVSVPDLVGKSLREVDVALMNSQLVLGNSAYVFSDKISPDRIVGQSPLSSEEYGVNKNVDLLISLGKKTETLPLPNLTGTNLDEAKTKLKAWGLNVGRIYSKTDPNKAKYQVISTSPAPYSYLRKGEVVNILVSSGSDAGTASAEDVKKFEFSVNSMPLPAPATAQPEKPAVVPPAVTPTAAPTVALANNVIHASSAETTATPVAEKKAELIPEIIAQPVAAPPAVSSSNTKEVSFVMPDGFMPKEVKFIHIKPDGREQIYSGTHKPLDSIKVKVPIVPNSKLQIYINDVPVEERRID